MPIRGAVRPMPSVARRVPWALLLALAADGTLQQTPEALQPSAGGALSAHQQDRSEVCRSSHHSPDPSGGKGSATDGKSWGINPPTCSALFPRDASGTEPQLSPGVMGSSMHPLLHLPFHRPHFPVFSADAS